MKQDDSWKYVPKTSITANDYFYERVFGISLCESCKSPLNDGDEIIREIFIGSARGTRDHLYHRKCFYKVHYGFDSDDPKTR